MLFDGCGTCMLGPVFRMWRPIHAVKRSTGVVHIFGCLSLCGLAFAPKHRAEDERMDHHG